MTRINLIEPRELHRTHLIAEYRELPRVLTLSARAYKAKRTINAPKEYVLGKGHMLFFYDKLMFLHNRYSSLLMEMERRGYNTNDNMVNSILLNFLEAPMCLYNDYKPTEKAIELNRQRINLRLKEKGLI